MINITETSRFESFHLATIDANDDRLIRKEKFAIDTSNVVKTVIKERLVEQNIYLATIRYENGREQKIEGSEVLEDMLSQILLPEMSYQVVTIIGINQLCNLFDRDKKPCFEMDLAKLAVIIQKLKNLDNSEAMNARQAYVVFCEHNKLDPSLDSTENFFHQSEFRCFNSKIDMGVGLGKELKSLSENVVSTEEMIGDVFVEMTRRYVVADKVYQPHIYLFKRVGDAANTSPILKSK